MKSNRLGLMGKAALLVVSLSIVALRRVIALVLWRVLVLSRLIVFLR